MKISYKLEPKELEIIKRAEEITCINYNVKDNMLDADMFISIIEDLIYEYEYVYEQYEDFKKDVEDNYKPITKEEMYR